MNTKTETAGSTPAHTPKWKVVKTPQCFRIVDESGITIGETYLGGADDERIAHLFAQAPDLLRQRDALLSALESLVKNPQGRIVREIARAAITAAKGAQP